MLLLEYDRRGYRYGIKWKWHKAKTPTSTLLTRVQYRNPGKENGEKPEFKAVR